MVTLKFFYFLEIIYKNAKNDYDKYKIKLEEAKNKAKEIYEKAQSNILHSNQIVDSEELQENFKKDQESKENKAEEQLKKVIRKYSRPPLSAREHINKEPVIRIYPDYNPKFSRNQMRPVSIKAWETARTMATTPFTSDQKGDPRSPDGFSRNSTARPFSREKPKTAAVGRLVNFGLLSVLE